MARAMGVDRGDSVPQLGRSGSKKKVLDKRQRHWTLSVLRESGKVSCQLPLLAGPVEGPAGDCEGQSEWQNQICYSTLGGKLVI